MRRENLDSCSLIEGLFQEIHNCDFYHIIRNEDSQMNALFFAHPQSLVLAKILPTVFILDCTYKKNNYCLPLLHIVVDNICNRSFSVAFCFLSLEHPRLRMGLRAVPNCIRWPIALSHCHQQRSCRYCRHWTSFSQCCSHSVQLAHLQEYWG